MRPEQPEAPSDDLFRSSPEAIIDPAHELIGLAALIDWGRFDDAFGTHYHEATVRREMRRRSGIEPVFGHLKEDGHLERNHLAGPEGDAINVIFCAAGDNMRLLARGLRLFVLMILAGMLCRAGKRRKHQPSPIAA